VILPETEAKKAYDITQSESESEKREEIECTVEMR
jgi:hypothetical protein